MIGIDIVDIEKFTKKADKKFIINIFTQKELDYASNKKNTMQTLAGIFASKEAIIKANNLNLSYILRKKIEIDHVNQKPLAYLKAKPLKGDISISHDANFAIATCLMKEDSFIQVKEEMKALLPQRKSDSHKGDYGRVAILGGSPGMAGSIYMASLSAMRTGTGLAYILAPRSISNILQIKANEQIINEIKCENFYYSNDILKQILENLQDKSCLVLGPGMGNGKNLNKLIGKIIKNTDIDMVIDADGLNALSEDLSILKYRDNIVLTPHLGEFSRLTGLTISEIKQDKVNIAKKFAKKNNIILVLKSNQTIVTDGSRIYINDIGNPGMATAGVGDVLTGVIASFMKKLEPYQASKLGVYVHSLAADIASYKLGEDSMIATDIIDNLPEAMIRLR